MAYIRPCFDANNILNLVSGQWSIDSNLINATANALNSTSSLLYNSVNIYVSQLLGSDANDGGEGNPLASIGAALTLAGSPPPFSPVVINILDGAVYNEQLVLDQPNIYIYGPFCQLTWDGSGDTLTINASGSGTLLDIAGIACNGGGNAIVNNFDEVVILNSKIFSGGAIVNNGAGALVINTLISNVDFTNNSSGVIFYEAAVMEGNVTQGVFGISALGINAPFFSISCPLTDTTGGNYNASIVSGSINAGNLSSGGSVSLIPTNDPNAQYQITGISLNGINGSNFIGGDRDLIITDGSAVWTTITAATLIAFIGTNTIWGSTFLPLPTSIDMSQLTQSGQQLVATYSGGTTDYTDGNLTLNIQYARIA